MKEKFLGQKYAMLEMKSCIGKIIRKFQLKPSSDARNNLQVTANVVLYSRTGINIEIERR